MLAGNGESYLGHQAFNFQVNNAAHELVTATDFSEVLPAAFNRRALWYGRQQTVNLGLRYAVVPTLRLDCLNLSFVDPLLQRRITDAQNFAGVAYRIKFRS